MKALQNLMYSMRAGYPYFYVQSFEMNKTIADIKDAVMAEEAGWDVKVWDFEKSPDPTDVIRLLNGDEKVLVIAKNFNWFLDREFEGIDKDLVTALQNSVDLYSSKDFRRSLLVVSNEGIETALPAVLLKDFMGIEFDRPDDAEIQATLEFIMDSARSNPKFVEPKGGEIKSLVDAGKGMTIRELKAAYSYSLVKTKGKLDPKVVATQRAKEVNKIDGLTLGVFEETFKDLVGYDVAKKFAAMNIHSPLSKGMLLVGPPGTGKTTFARALANTFGMVCIEMEMANLFGGIVGETEAKVKAALDIIKANAPCVWFIDEIEKGLAGVGGNGANTTGGKSEVTERAMAQVLKFMSHNRPPGVYCVATSNDAASLPSEWVRPGRWDSAPWYVGLPSDATKTGIFEHYIKKGFKVEGMDEALYPTGNIPAKKDLDKWTGAEIETVCRLSAQMEMTIDECRQFIKPVAVTMSEQFEALEKWAVTEERTIPAEAAVKNEIVIDREIDF